ncbi:Long-chain-fatty-acid--CoA ligase 4 [Halocaridina rubra]|uniref:long-chain-fatty-acid--CoA ligase n=1 Tax=Halocaridina rubra TaxID=373956 RepID=A0AAN9A7M9_HALRR
MVIERGGLCNEAGYWVKGDGGHKRGFGLVEELKKADATTLPQLLKYATDKHGDAHCLGTRQMIARERKVENGKKLEKLKFGDYNYLTYVDVQDMVVNFSKGLYSNGMRSGDRIAMFAETRAEWFVAALGCLRHNVAVVTIYTNLADDSIVDCINETEVSFVVTSYDILPRLMKIIPRCPNVSQIIVIEDQLEGVGSVQSDGIIITPFKEVLSMGESCEDYSHTAPAEEDIAIIMYTSGSTSHPKGVQLTHVNIMWAIKAYLVQADLTLGDRYLAYLPLAHVMELGTELAMLALNVTIAYSSPMTITSTSPKIMKGTLGDAKVAQPTCMSAVPLILERIIKGVTKVIEDQGYLKAKIFSEALKFKQRQDRPSFSSRVLDAIIFNRIKEELGGQLRMLVVGGAPLSPETHNKFRAIFGCTIQVGYGATETAASATSMDSDDPRTGHCGPPNLGVLIQLKDWEEGGYLSTDKPYPRGEIIVGGPMISKGYFKLPAETEESFYEEDGVRWFRTGDVGEFDDTGVLHVIDRKKDLVKLNNGEYVSLGNVESTLKTHPLIESLCTYAYSGATAVVGIVVPVVDRLLKLGVSLGYTEDANVKDLCCDEKVTNAVLQEIQAHGKKRGLGRWDIPSAIFLSSESWTPESGLVTAALKIRRKNVKEHFNSAIEKMYNSLNIAE